MRACWLKWVGRDWSISADYIWLNYSGANTYVARYYLFAPHSDAICAFYEPNMDNLLSGYDKLIVIESNSAEMGLLKKHYGVTGKVGVYRIEKNGTRVNLIAE